MTTSPTLTSSGTRWPLSSMRPGPTAMTVPSCGFSLAVSGMTRPEAVVVSASLAWTTTRSSSGLMVTLVAVVTSVTPPSVSDGWWVLMLWHGVGARRRGDQAPARVVGTLPTRVPAAQQGPSGGWTAVPPARRRGWRGAGRPAPRRRRRCDALAPGAGRRGRGGARGATAGRGGGSAPRARAAADRVRGAARRVRLGAGQAARPRPAGVRRGRRRPVPDRRHPRAGRPAAAGRPPAGGVFGAAAAVLSLPAAPRERAGGPQLAARRARRLLAGGADSAADLGCAAGTDAIALARAGASVLAVDRDPLARELTVANAAALGLADRVWVAAGDVEELVATARGGGVAGGAAATLDPARRAEGRRQLHPDRWSPPWPTVEALLDRVPRSVVKVAPGLDHDRVPEGVEAEWVSVGGSIVEALLWGRGISETWRRAALVHDDAVLELTADEDPGPAPVGPVGAWLHEPDPAAIRSGLVSLVAADLGATLVDPTIAYLTSGAPAGSPWVSSFRVDDVLPFNLKKLRALLRARGVGRVTVKKRGSAIEPEALTRQLRGPGTGTATVVVTRVAGAPTALVCDVSG